MPASVFLERQHAARKRLSVGLLAPPWVPVPPPSYGGIEQVVAMLADGLVERGHEVIMVAAPGSLLSGGTVISPLDALPAVIGEQIADWRHALAGADALADVDVVIDHSGPLGALLTSALPSLHVVHGPLDPIHAGIYAGIARHAANLRLVAISHAQRAMAPELPFAGVCHNGLDLAAATFRARSDGYLAFLGRMSAEKGPRDAIRIARQAGLPLLIAAKCREPAEHAYFAEHVAPHLGPEVVWLGELDAAGKYALLGGAAALVFPIAWPEPFGMVMIEAMACGTPVLATACGSVPEVVADGLTGFVRQSADELIETVARIGEIDRSACRRWVAERFSADAMTAGYERLALGLAAGRRPARERRFFRPLLVGVGAEKSPA
jgi:glycosyltransferase involved in cell wall biosynthesis